MVELLNQTMQKGEFQDGPVGTKIPQKQNKQTTMQNIRDAQNADRTRCGPGSDLPAVPTPGGPRALAQGGCDELCLVLQWRVR